MGDTTMNEQWEKATMTDSNDTWNQIRVAYVRQGGLFGHYGAQSRQKAYDAALAAHDAEVAANALREFATHLDGGTPRAWGFHHPCDPAGVRWEPNSDEQVTMRDADLARDRADRIERGATTPNDVCCFGEEDHRG